MSGMTKAYARNSRSQLSVGKRVVLPLVSREAHKRKGADVVEVGCGPGTLLAALAPMIAAAPLGLDRDALGVSLARKAGLRARRADFRRIPAGLKGRFGVAFSNEALHWTPSPPARFLRAAWFYRFLPASARASFTRWGEARFAEGLRGAAQLLEPGGAAVLQFGGRGQIQALYEAFDWALAHPRFERCRGRLWYPIYYPNPRSLPRLLACAGLKAVRVRAWSEPLAERSPAETVKFVRAFTERTFLGALRAPDRELFYDRLGARLRETGLRRIRWQRTLIVARKSRGA
jgi:SAM-dependent methyltransferase